MAPQPTSTAAPRLGRVGWDESLAETIIYTLLLMAHEMGNFNLIIVAFRELLHIEHMQTHQSQQPQISRHAVERYQQRVTYIPPAEAARRLTELAADSTRRPTPRRWTSVPPGPGVLFLYP